MTALFLSDEQSKTQRHLISSKSSHLRIWNRWLLRHFQLINDINNQLTKLSTNVINRSITSVALCYFPAHRTLVDSCTHSPSSSRTASQSPGVRICSWHICRAVGYKRSFQLSATEAQNRSIKKLNSNLIISAFHKGCTVIRIAVSTNALEKSKSSKFVFPPRSCQPT